MTDPGMAPTNNVPTIKKELDSFGECSPSNSDLYSPTTTTIINDNVIQSSDVSPPSLSYAANFDPINKQRMEYQEHYENRMQSPDSPETQFCSSTTQPHTETGIGHSEVSFINSCTTQITNSAAKTLEWYQERR